MKKQLVLLSIASSLLLASCTKDVTEPISSPTTAVTGLTTAKGTPLGNAVSAVISTAGGELASADGAIKVTIPSGAIVSNTTFSIQPITNNTPNGVGAAYRLLPEGTHFAKPITITFQYVEDSIKGSLPDLLYVAYQDSAGVWEVQKNTTLNSGAKMVSVQSTHFSDWSLFESYKLKVDNDVLGYSGSTELKVMEATVLPDLKGNSIITEETTDNKVSNWSLDGEGVLAFKEAAIAVYNAPAYTPSKNPVQISVAVNDIVNSQGDHGKEILFANILIGEGYMDVSFNSNNYHLGTCTADVSPDASTMKLVITALATGAIGARPASISIESNSDGPGVYPFGDVLKLNKSLLSANFDNNASFFYNTQYTMDCNTQNVAYTIGSISITKIGGIGGFVEGSFDGKVVYQRDACSTPAQYPITGKFMAKRIH